MKEIIKLIKTTLENILDLIIKMLGGININKIVIPKNFKKAFPQTEKLTRKMRFYYINGYFEDNIIIDENNTLIDGYTTYLISKNLDFKYIAVKRVKLKNKGEE